MKKAFALLLAAVMVLCLFAGCTNDAKPADDAKGSVYWLNFKPELDETLQDLAKTYTDKTGVSVKVVTAASGTYSQTLTSEMDKSSAPTLFVIGNQAGVKQWKDYALDLKGTAIEKELNTDAYNLYDESGKLVSIGYCYECYGIIANPTLIEQAGHTMDEIKNFAGLKAVAEDIHARAAELGFDAFSSSDMDSSSSWRFTGHMANLEYFYEERDAGGWTECPATLNGKYMENFKNLYDLCINGFTHPFEDVEVKQNAPALLEAALRSRRKPCMIGTGSMSDPYMHCEASLGLTRRCLELIERYGFGAALLTKSDLLLRDLDLLEAIHRRAKCVGSIAASLRVQYSSMICLSSIVITPLSGPFAPIHGKHGGWLQAF